MNTQPGNTNSNLVLNGDYKEGYSNWEDLNGSEFMVKRDTWKGNLIKYAELKNETSIFQTLNVEVEPAEGARYQLSFLYENTYKSASGRVLIGKKGVDDEDKLSIDLPPTGPQPVPPAIDLHELKCYLPLDLVLHKGEDLDVTLISPKRTPEDTSAAEIRLTGIELHVELVPLLLLKVVHDTQRFDPGQVLYLCLEAKLEQRHQLSFEVHPDSHWVDTDAALWADDNPQEAMITSPEWGINQRIEMPWLLDCPELEGEAPYLFELNIYSKYTADPYPIAVSLGHHRLKLNVIKDATFWPVLGDGQKVPLEVQVLSHYTGKPVSGVDVTWCLGDDVLYRGTSDGEGKAGFDYIPNNYGVQTIEVSVPSPYYEDPTVKQLFDIRVLKDDPLKAVQVRFERGEAAAWGEKTGFPDRGSTYSVALIVPENSPLQGSKIALCWSKDGYQPEDLGVTSVPDFGMLTDVTGTELEWTLDCGDLLDAPFGLFLSNPMLQRDSRENAMSLARNSLKIGEVREANKSPAVDEGDSVYCMIQVLTLNNEPAPNVPVDWVWPHGRFTSYTGVEGWASVFDKPTQADPYEMVAQINVREGAPSLTRSFPIVPLATSEWKDDIDFFFDTKPIESQGAGILCWRGKPHTFGIAPKRSGSPFIDQTITLDWRKGVDPDLGLVFDPPLGRPVLLTNEGLQWAITSGSTRSGLFDLEVESKYLERKRELTGRLMAEKFDDEVTLVFDQRPSPIGHSTLYPCIGATHQLILLPHAFSPLQGLEVSWNTSSPLPEKVDITPDTQTPVLITAGGVRYTVDCSASSGKAQFDLSYHLNPKIDLATSAQHCQLDHNKLKVGAVRQAAIDPVMSKGERAWLEVQYLSWFSGLPASGMPVQWSDSTSRRMQSETDADGWAGHDYDAKTPGLNRVDARVVNPYDGTFANEVCEVFALDPDPWLDLDVKSEDSSTVHKWAETTFFPRRNGQFDFVVSANEGSYLHGQHLALGLTGTGPSELALTMGPVTFGQWRQLQDELPFTLTAGDEKDGGFSFRLAASRLLALSPLNAVSLGGSSRVIKMSAINSRFEFIDWGSEFEAQVIVVSALSGKPMVGVVVVWEGLELEPVSARTNFYGVAKIRFIPSTPEAGEVTATVGEGLHSVSVSLPYFLNHPREIQALSSPTPIAPEGTPVSAAVTVGSSMTREPLQGVEVMWNYPGITLSPTYTDHEGIAQVFFRLPGVRRGRLAATVRGGYGGWDVTHIEFELELASSASNRKFDSCQEMVEAP